MRKSIVIASIFALALIGTPVVAEETAITTNEITVPVVLDTIPAVSEFVPDPDRPLPKKDLVRCPIRPNTENNTVDHRGELCIPFYRMILETVQSSETTSPFAIVDED